MSKFTIELHELLKDKNFELFDFDYEFYEDAHKKAFEDKFINHYMFHEIGFETVKRFKHYLRERLNLLNRYYSQLYQTELRSQDGSIDFMLNKDLRETFIREIEGENTSKATTKSEGENSSESKESNLDNGNATLSLNSSLTSTSKTDNNASSSSSSDSQDKSKQTEGTELISKGNIGVTSSGQLLEDWRRVLINIDQMIIEECSDLFMLVY